MGEGDHRRNLTQSIKVPGTRNKRIQLSLNVLNLLDEDTAINRWAPETRQNIPISDAEFTF